MCLHIVANKRPPGISYREAEGQKHCLELTVATLSLPPCLIDIVIRASLSLFHNVVAGLRSPQVAVIWPRFMHL